MSRLRGLRSLAHKKTVVCCASLMAQLLGSSLEGGTLKVGVKGPPVLQNRLKVSLRQYVRSCFPVRS